MSAVPPIVFTDAGVVLPTEAAVLAGVQSDYDSAFGGGLNPALNTPQGQLASSTAAIIAEKNSEIAYMVNEFDPQYASGRWQDGLAQIYFLNRKGAESTVVSCTLGGVPTSVIPAGTLAQDTNGNTYILQGTVTIGSGGTVTGQFANIVTGAIACPAGSLIKVYQAVTGWDTVTNPADGVLGNDVETRAEFETRRFASVALNGRGTCPSIYANVFNVAGVLDVFCIDNPTGAASSANPFPWSNIPNSSGYDLAEHSLYVAVIGGTDADVAQQIWNQKPPGCNYNGNTTVAVQDQSGYSFPYPTYNVTFERPTALPIYFEVNIINNPSLPSDIATQIQAAIVAQFNGETDLPRARIGSLILATGFYATVAGVNSAVLISSMFVGTSASPSTTQVQVGIDQGPTIGTGNIVVNLV